MNAEAHHFMEKPSMAEKEHVVIVIKVKFRRYVTSAGQLVPDEISRHQSLFLHLTHRQLHVVKEIEDSGF